MIYLFVLVYTFAMCLPTPLNGCASLLQNVEIIFTVERMNTTIVSIISLRGMRTSTKTKSERIKRHQGNLDYQLEGVVQNVLRINNNNIRKYRTGNTNNDSNLLFHWCCFV
jgi:DNA replication protein DnaD